MKKTTLKKSFVIATSCLIGAFSANAQFSFTNSNSLISNLTRSGCAISVVDINNDGLDDIVKMDQSDVLVIDLQNTNGTFTNYDLGTITGGSNVWGMALADVDHNGWKDVATGTNGTMYLVKLSWTGTTIAKTTTTLAGSYFVQNITFGDINNDGWVDLAVCDDNDFMKIYKNNSGTMSLTTSLIDTEIYPGMAYGGDPYDSGNYGSVWLDFDNDGDLDLYIAHCRQSASSSSDQRRRDRLFVNNGSNVYTEQAATYGIEISNFKQTWTTSFGDLDNDGDFDVVMTNHGENGQILKNDGSGHFTDVTASTGWVTSIDPIESVVEDFDNDGFLDIMISGSQWYMWHNNGNMTFTPVTGVLPNLGGLLSFATGDLNHDGFIDLQTSYGNVYNSPSTADNDVLYLNNKNSNHFITFNLTGTASNHDAIGAKVIITGAFGTQVREVRAGETYGTANSMQLHFGLGANTTITSAVIEWPAGGTTTFGTLAADQFVTAVEGTCTITGNVIPGPYTYCTGSSVVLTAQPGYSSYLWSNGSTAASVTSTSTSNYNVLVTSAAGCSNLSPTVSTVLNPPEIPLVSTSGVNSCAGTLTLTSSAAAAYSWTGPAGFTATTQAINPSVTGTYSLTTTGLCQNWTAAPTAVNVLAAPSPTGTGAAGPGPASFNISAAGAGGTLNWYDAAAGGTLLGSGAAFTTPVISSTTNYYVDETTNYPGSIYNGGRSSGAGSNSSNLNAGLDFDVLAPCTLTSVKVYATTTGAKTIQLKNSAGTVLNSFTTAVLPVDSSVITLNFPLTPGTGYRLTQSSGTAPALKRNTSGVTYPYTTPGFVSITNGYTGSTTSSAAYYYYYDWKITTPTVSCTSPRVPVVATILTSACALTIASSAQTNVSCNGGANGTISIITTGGVGALVFDWTPGNPTGDGTASVTNLTAGSYTCTITDANGCTTVQTATIIQPSALVSTITSQSNVSCFAGTNGAASISISGGTTSYSYNWTPGNPTGDGTASVSNLTAGSYTCSIFDSNSCTTTQTVTINQPAEINNSQNIFICAEESLVIGTHIYSTSGIYTDVLSAINGCDSIITTNLTVNPSIDLTSTTSGISITANANPANYQWIDCNNGNSIIVGAISQSFTSTAAGNYAVIISQNGCSDTSACINLTSTSIVLKLKNEDLQIYPNPASAAVNVEFGYTMNSVTVIEINDVTGRLVKTESFENPVKGQIVSLNVSELNAGSYMITIKNNAQKLVQKLVLTK